MQLLFVQKDDGEQGNGLAEGYQVDVDKMTVQKVGRPGCMHAWVHGAGPNCHRKFAMPSISTLTVPETLFRPAHGNRASPLWLP